MQGPPTWSAPTALALFTPSPLCSQNELLTAQPVTAFLLSFWTNSNRHHHHYMTAVQTKTCKQGVTQFLVHTGALLSVKWAPPGPTQGGVGSRCVPAAPAPIAHPEPQRCSRSASVLSSGACHACCPTGPLHVLSEYLKTTDLSAVSSCLASH